MKKHGFTLIELLIVIAIAVIISGALVPLFSVTKQDAKFAKAKWELDVIKRACVVFHFDTEEWPFRLTGYGPELVTNIRNLPGWEGPYLDKWPIEDPWGGEYQLAQTGFIVDPAVEWTNGPDRLVAYSVGNNAQLDTTDPYVVIAWFE